MAHSYGAMFNLKVSMLRFFTVYGPWEDPTWLYLNLQKYFRK